MAQLVARLVRNEKARGSNPLSSTLCDVSRHRRQGEPSGFALFRVLGLVSAGGVEGEVAEDFACGGVEDGDVEVVW